MTATTLPPSRFSLEDPENRERARLARAAKAKARAESPLRRDFAHADAPANRRSRRSWR